MVAVSVAFYLREVSDIFIFIGNGDSVALRNPPYDFNDDAIEQWHCLLGRIGATCIDCPSLIHPKGKTMSDIAHWSISETSSALKSKQVSVTEVTQAILSRIEAVNPAVNAVVTPVNEALEIACALDDAGRPDDASPLWGIPVTTKINVDQEGYANSNGIKAYEAALATGDSPVVSNLKSSGAVVVGRTSTPEFSMRWFTSNPIHGVSLNPWDHGITPGGSSGAAAAAVASGMGMIGHGNDLGGSLRYPAYCCGVATIKPSTGRVPAMNPTQTANGVERGPITQMMSVQGPIARSIADVRAAMHVMAQPDLRDPLHMPVSMGRDGLTGPVTVGYAMNPFHAPLDETVERAMQTALAAVKDAGIEVREVAPPHAADLPALWGKLLFTESEALTRASIQANGSEDMRAYFDAFTNLFEPTDIEGLLSALQQRIVCQRAWAQMFTQVDVLMMPTSLARPFQNDQDFKSPETLPQIAAAQSPLVAINVLGLPSAALPTHLEDGIPSGVQLVGPMLQDGFVLDVAERLERELGTIWRQLPAFS